MNDINTLRKNLRKRNHQEMVACLIVIIAFVVIGIDKETIISKVFCFQIVLSAMGVSYYLYNQSHKKLLEANDSKEQYIFILNNEIKLLSSVRYWYVFPMQFGLTGIVVESIVRDFNAGKSPMWDIIYLLITFCLSFGVIYLNEVKGVQKLKEELALAQS
ncbi:hypothetical protein M899_3236 [Bacteriovorax sp. BSW11_IV]|uniref:hypothetical protein n=1 Tax=Bacteriovorax sp. BSW11_IV TaxID=1353529 RepID=UPI00038A3471|nr:hypothetical protein [Bacteriovorax sp. BSW11_IV]EQC48250.1 hypothetical protein M899_3236 [Bacteriovorax sp. BSW11_IV]